MNRPQIINPATKQIMNVFSEEFEDLLDQGYTIQDLLNLPLLKTSSNIPFTGFPDIDRALIIHLPLYELNNLCDVNKYSKSLCNTKEFWLDKMKLNNLELPDVQIKNIDWLTLYNALYNATENINDIVIGYYEFIMIDSFQVSDLLKLLKLSNIIIPNKLLKLSHEQRIPSIIVYFENDEYIINIKFKIIIMKSQMLLFLTYLYYYNLFTDNSA